MPRSPSPAPGRPSPQTIERVVRGALLLIGAAAAAHGAASTTSAAAAAPLWPCSSAHRLPDAGADAAPVYFQVLSAAGCECVFTLEGPPGSVLRLALGERAARGFYGAPPASFVPPAPPAWSGPDCSRGAVRAFALAPSGELQLRATVCGPQSAAPPFVTETNVAVLTSTAPWGRLPLRVDVLRVRGPNATEELAPAPPPTPTPTPVTSTEANAATTPVTRAADVTTGATTRELPATAAAEAEDDEEQEREAAITTPGTTTASATPDTNTIPVDVDYATDESINLV